MRFVVGAAISRVFLDKYQDGCQEEVERASIVYAEQVDDGILSIAAGECDKRRDGWKPVGACLGFQMMSNRISLRKRGISFAEWREEGRARFLPSRIHKCLLLMLLSLFLVLDDE